MSSPILRNTLVRTLPPQLRPPHLVHHASTSNESHLPRIAQPALWRTFIPRVLRRSPPASPSQTPRKSNRFLANPATPILILAMLTGNASIHIITQKQRMRAQSDLFDRKSALLREVIRRVQSGEDVDVDGELGTGDPGKEMEWERVLRELVEEGDGELVGRRERQRRRRGMRLLDLRAGSGSGSGSDSRETGADEGKEGEGSDGEGANAGGEESGGVEQEDGKKKRLDFL